MSKMEQVEEGLILMAPAQDWSFSNLKEENPFFTSQIQTLICHPNRHQGTHLLPAMRGKSEILYITLSIDGAPVWKIDGVSVWYF